MSFTSQPVCKLIMSVRRIVSLLIFPNVQFHKSIPVKDIYFSPPACSSPLIASASMEVTCLLQARPPPPRRIMPKTALSLSFSFFFCLSFLYLRVQITCLPWPAWQRGNVWAFRWMAWACHPHLHRPEATQDKTIWISQSFADSDSTGSMDPDIGGPCKWRNVMFWRAGDVLSILWKAEVWKSITAALDENKIIYIKVWFL